MANTILATLSLLCAVIVTNFYHHDPSSRSPKWLRRLVHNHLAPALRVRIEENDDDAEEPELLQPIGKPGKPTESDTPPNGIAGNIVNRLHLQTIAESDEEKQQPNDDALSRIKSEWTTIGRVFDRLFFVVILSATMIVSVGMLGIYPLCGAQYPSEMDLIQL